MLAAIGASGTTTISNAAREPEIVDLQTFLRKLGANVRGAGTSTVVVEGAEQPLHGCRHRILGDRIAAATYLAAAAAAGGDVFLRDIDYRHLSTVTGVLRQAGCTLSCREDGIRLVSDGCLRAVSPVRTAPYPGFPTDAQAVVMSALLRSSGTTVFVENIFESRYHHVPELVRMGADIRLEGRVAVVCGVDRLQAARVRAMDLRGGAALVIAGFRPGASPRWSTSTTSAGATVTCPATWPFWGPAYTQRTQREALPMTQPRRHRRTRRKRQGNFAFLYRLLAFVAICIAIVGALSLFFKADQIFVTGTSRYSQQQVLRASGIRQGGNLFLLNKHQAASAITEQLPYVESVRIRRQLPNALRIEITECTHPLAMEQDGVLWLLNGSGKIIDKLQPGQGESCPLVTGLTLTSPQLGQLAVPENRDKWDLLQQLWQLLRSKDMAGDVQSLDLTDSNRITLRYLDRFDVVLRTDDDLDYRLNYLAAVVQRLDGSDQGTIQWDKDGKARFIPD